MSRLRVRSDRVLVQVDGAVEQTAAGIVLAPQAQDRPTTGTIVGVGEAVTDLSVGQRVCYAAWSGTVYAVDGLEYFVLRQGEIIGVVEPDEAALDEPEAA